ncbi:MAG: cation-translocating P-type ATPase [Patescibacteria group bacterium]
MSSKIQNNTCDHCEPETDKSAVSSLSVNWKKLLTWVAGISVVTGFFLNLFGFNPETVTAIYSLAIASGGIYVIKGAWRGLSKQKFLNIDFLVVIASLGAIYLGELPEAAAVIFFFSLAEAFEDYGIDRSRRALQALLHKSPQTATLLDGKTIPVSEVIVGQKVQVKPGELIPLDGKVIKGLSAVNEATITGESIPKDKREGDTVFAGTLNENGYLEIEVTKESKNSTFSKIIALVEQAQKAKAPTQEFIDRFAKYYTPSVVLIALIVAAALPLITGEPFVIWLERAITLLVIACPCALVISTPVAITSAIGGASHRGVLIKGGKHLEELKNVRAVAFDKTGTLTLGEPYISDVIAFNGFTEKDVLEDAAGVEQFSSHPLSKSILAYAKEKGINPHSMQDYQNIAGKGGKATCMVCDDLEHCVGNLKLMDAHGVTTKEILEKTEKLEREGKTVVLVSEGDKIMGALAISDRIKDEAKQTIEKLTAMGVTSIMLTGDNQHTASYVAETLGIKEAHGSLLPDEKVKKIQMLKDKYGSVAMVGDGVNDAPSLALSNVGIAMGAKGSDVAIETADIALMNDNILNIPYAVGLSKKALRTVKQNVTAALISKLAFIVLAIFGISNLGIAIAADTGVAILVILNGLRLFKTS